MFRTKPGNLIVKTIPACDDHVIDLKCDYIQYINIVIKPAYYHVTVGNA